MVLRQHGNRSLTVTALTAALKAVPSRDRQGAVASCLPNRGD
jgi:hypothetical protein